MKVAPKQSLQSSPLSSQKSVVVVLEDELEELSESVEGVALPELDEGVVPLESGPDDEQVSIPNSLSPGM